MPIPNCSAMLNSVSPDSTMYVLGPSGVGVSDGGGVSVIVDVAVGGGGVKVSVGVGVSVDRKGRLGIPPPGQPDHNQEQTNDEQDDRQPAEEQRDHAPASPAIGVDHIGRAMFRLGHGGVSLTEPG